MSIVRSVIRSITRDITRGPTERFFDDLAGFSDDFNRPDELLNASPNWDVLGLTDSLAQASGNVLIATGTNEGRVYRSPDMQSASQQMQLVLSGEGNGFFVQQVSDVDNYIGLRARTGRLETFTRVGGTLSNLANYDAADWTPGDTVIWTVDGTIVRVFVNGVQIVPATGTENYASRSVLAGTRQGVAPRGTIANWADDYKTGSDVIVP